jgi:hypothetical protein
MVAADPDHPNRGRFMTRLPALALRRLDVRKEA